MSAKKKAHREVNKPYNVKHISSAIGTSSTKPFNMGSPSIEIAAAQHETKAPASDKPPVKDHFIRGVFNGIGLTLILLAIPLLFAYNFGSNQSQSLYQSKVEIVQLKMAQLENDANLLQNQINNNLAQEETILALIDEKQTELKAINSSTITTQNKLDANAIKQRTLRAELEALQQQKTSSVIADNLPDMPRFVNPFN